MFCPSCRAEYREGFYRCASCDVDLVATLPQDEGGSQEEIVAAFKTADIVLLSVVKSLLDSFGIEYVVQGEEGLHMIPLGVSGGFFNPKALGAVVLVRKRDQEAVRELLAAMEQEEETSPPESYS